MNIQDLHQKLPALASLLFTGLRMVSAVIWMACTLVILILEDPAPAFRQFLIAQAIEQTRTWTGLPLSIDGISELQITPAQQVLQLDHLSLMEAPNSRKRFLDIPHLRLELNLLAYLLQKPALNRLQIHQPHFFVRRDPRGQLNFKPHLKKMQPKPEEPPGKQPYLPQIEIKIDETQIHYRDQDPQYSRKLSLFFCTSFRSLPMSPN